MMAPKKNFAWGLSVAGLYLAAPVGAAHAGAPSLTNAAMVAPSSPVTQVQYCCGGGSVGVASTVSWRRRTEWREHTAWRPRSELRAHTIWRPHTVLRPVTVWRPTRTVTRVTTWRPTPVLHPVTNWRPVVHNYYYYSVPVYVPPEDRCCNSGLFGAF